MRSSEDSQVWVGRTGYVVYDCGRGKTRVIRGDERFPGQIKAAGTLWGGGWGERRTRGISRIPSVQGVEGGKTIARAHMGLGTRGAAPVRSEPVGGMFAQEK